jgi:hypothetical protein
MLRTPYAQRRARPEQLLTEHQLAAPWTLPGDERPGDGTGVAGVVDRGARRRGARDPRQRPAVLARCPRAVQGAPQGHHRGGDRRDHRDRAAPADARAGPPQPHRGVAAVGRSTTLVPDMARHLADRPESAAAGPGEDGEGARKGAGGAGARRSQA